MPLPKIEPADLKITPLETASTIPASWCADPAFYPFDRDRVLRANWQYVGAKSRLNRPGAYIAEEVAGAPLIVVMTPSKELRCFYNVCRHRGGPLATEDGRGRVLRCRYHAWTYSLEGKLIGTPKFDGVQNFDPRECSLKEVRLADYDGLLFADLSGEAPPLERLLGGVRERIAPIDLSKMRFAHRDVYHVAANWKVYVDNYMEGYHIVPVHPELATVLDVSGYRTEVENDLVLQWGPFSGGQNPYGVDGGNVYYYFIFPNIMLNILPGRMQVNSVIPLGPRETITIFDYFYTETDPERLSRQLAKDREFSDLVQKQDIDICERVQRGLESGAYERGRLSVQEELGVHAFQSMLRRSYQKALERG